MKLALGISIISGFCLVLLYSILVGVMVPGWKSSNDNFLYVLEKKAVVYTNSSNVTMVQGWSFVNVSGVIIAIPNGDFYGPIEQGVIVASCAGLGVLFFLVLSLSLIIRFCVNRQLVAKKTGNTDIPYSMFDEVK